MSEFSDLLNKIHNSDKNYLNFTDAEVGLIERSLSLAVALEEKLNDAARVLSAVGNLLRTVDSRTVLVSEDEAEEEPWRHIGGAIQTKMIVDFDDPTHGRIDKDIQDQVAGMNPSSLGQKVAMENTIQNKRNRSLGKEEV